MTGPSGATRLVLLALVALMVATGCTGLPSTGPVQVEQIRDQVEDVAPVDFIPGGPERGATPVEIVRGFLVALQATPVNTSVARRFLTDDASQRWVPEEGTLVYDQETRSARGSSVRLVLADTFELSRRGGWIGERGERTYRLRVVRRDGQWRISNPPDRLIIPRTHFETRFSLLYLYFFDKSAQVLVPEPVYVPTGAQATTALVVGLLGGPGRDLLGVERTFFPARTRLDDISVPVSQDGTAEVPLSDEVLDLDPEQLDLAFAQLAWTLRQVPGIARMRVTVDGSPLDLKGVGLDPSVDRWSEFDPSVTWASESLFGIRNGRVVTDPGDGERRITGPFGSLDLDLRRIAVDLAGEQVAATTSSGAVLVAPRSTAAGAEPQPEDVRTVFTGGTDLLAPAWDNHGTLWVLDRTAAGAELTLARGGATRTLRVPRVSGRDARAMLLSRDGTRLVAVVAGKGREQIVVARIERDPAGRVRGVVESEPLQLRGFDLRSVIDVGWLTPGSLALLVVPSPETAQLVGVTIDGSSTADESTTVADAFQAVAEDLVTTPVVGGPVYLRTSDGQMLVLSASGRWTGSGIRRGLRSPTFVG